MKKSASLYGIRDHEHTATVINLPNYRMQRNLNELNTYEWIAYGNIASQPSIRLFTTDVECHTNGFHFLYRVSARSIGMDQLIACSASSDEKSMQTRSMSVHPESVPVGWLQRRENNEVFAAIKGRPELNRATNNENQSEIIEMILGWVCAYNLESEKNWTYSICMWMCAGIRQTEFCLA